MRFRLLCDAIPFCYGPAAALDAFLGALFASSTVAPAVDVLATGSTRELLERSSLPIRLLPIDSEDPAALETVPFASYDAFFNVCNPVSFGAARRAGTPIAYLDFLLWMHSGAIPDYFDADLYLAENYPGTREWVLDRGANVANLDVVAPLITPATHRRSERGFLLIGLGGLYSRLTVPGQNNNYAPFVVRSVLDAIPAGRFSRVLIAGPARLAQTMHDLTSGRTNVEYASLSHDEFVETLSRAELFVSHPGLYAAFEAMLGGVPTAFLPPSNYTQVLQLRHYRSSGLAEASFSWEDAGLGEIPAGLPEADGVRAVLDVVANAEHSAAVARALHAMLAGFFDRNSDELEALGERQKKVSSSFGTNGPQESAERFLAWVSAGRPVAQ